MVHDGVTPEGKAGRNYHKQSVFWAGGGVGREGGGSGGDRHLYRSVAILAEMTHTVGKRYSIRRW